MLTQSTEATTQKELDLNEERVEVEVGTDAQPIGRLVFPPIPRLLQSAHAAGTQVDPGDEPVALEGAESELERVLSRYSEFQDSATYLAKASRLALACRRLDTARELATQAVARNASNPNLRYRQAEALLQSEEYREAEGTFRELANLGHLRSCLRLAELAIRQADFGSAASWLQRASTIDETDWRVQAISGTLALATGRFAQAVRCFRNSLEDRPRSVSLHYDLGLAHVLTGHLKHAMTAFRRAMGLDPFQRRTLMGWSDLSVHLRKDLPQVARALSRYLRLDPSDLPTIDRLAYVLREQGDRGESFRLLTGARRGNDDPRTSNNLGVLAAERRRLPLAVKEFSRALELLSEPQNDEQRHLRSVTTANLMGSLIEAGSFETAVNVARAFAASISVPQLLAEEPECRVADGLIESLMGCQRLEEAMQLAEDWVDTPGIKPRLEGSLSEKLVCYFTLERVDGDRALAYAIRAYQVQCHIEPRDPVKHGGSINNLAFALIEMGQHDEAADYLSRLPLLPEPYRAFAYATRGLLALRTGKLKKGQDLYQRAIALADQKSKRQLQKKLHWELARYWRETGDAKKSSFHLRRVLRTQTGSIWKLHHLDTEARTLLGPNGR